MTESVAAVAFYTGLASVVFGTIRVARASLERHRRDGAGIGALVFGAACLAFAVTMFLSSSRAVLPF